MTYCSSEQDKFRRCDVGRTYAAAGHWIRIESRFLSLFFFYIYWGVCAFSHLLSKHLLNSETCIEIIDILNFVFKYDFPVTPLKLHHVVLGEKLWDISHRQTVLRGQHSFIRFYIIYICTTLNSHVSSFKQCSPLRMASFFPVMKKISKKYYLYYYHINMIHVTSLSLNLFPKIT